MAAGGSDVSDRNRIELEVRILEAWVITRRLRHCAGRLSKRRSMPPCCGTTSPICPTLPSSRRSIAPSRIRGAPSHR